MCKAIKINSALLCLNWDQVCVCSFFYLLRKYLINRWMNFNLILQNLPLDVLLQLINIWSQTNPLKPPQLISFNRDTMHPSSSDY